MLPQFVSNFYNKLDISQIFTKGLAAPNGERNIVVRVGIVAGGGSVVLILCVALRKWRHFKKDPRQERDRMKGLAAWKYGGIKTLEANKNLEKPEIINPDELLIKVQAVSVDPIDIRILHGYARALHSYLAKFKTSENGEFPIIPGRDCSGIVVETGSDVQSFKKGDHVWAFAPPWQRGLMAEYVVLKENQVDFKPSNLSFETAASMPYAALMTWDALVRHANLGPGCTEGKRVLIHIGSSACGSLAVQLIKSWGGHVTTTVPTNGLPLVRMLGADDVIVYSVTDFKNELQAREKFDVVLNTVGSVIHELCVELCVPGGSTVSTVSTFPATNNQTNFVTASLTFLRSIIKEILRSPTASSHLGNFTFDKNILGKIKELIESGKLEPVVEEVFTFEQCLAAFDRVAGGDSVGRTVVRIS